MNGSFPVYRHTKTTYFPTVSYTHLIPPILLNTIVGFNEVPQSLIETATGLGMTKWQKLYKVSLPLASPHILNGIKLALIEVIASATLATYIGACLLYTSITLVRVNFYNHDGLLTSIFSSDSHLSNIDTITR